MEKLVRNGGGFLFIKDDDPFFRIVRRDCRGVGRSLCIRRFFAVRKKLTEARFFEFFNQSAERLFQRFIIPRFHEKMRDQTLINGRHHLIYLSSIGEKNSDQCGIFGFDLGQKVNSGPTGHSVIGKNRGDGPSLKKGHSIFGAFREKGVISLLLKEPRQAAPDIRFIVNNEDTVLFHKASFQERIFPSAAYPLEGSLMAITLQSPYRPLSLFVGIERKAISKPFGAGPKKGVTVITKEERNLSLIGAGFSKIGEDSSWSTMASSVGVRSERRYSPRGSGRDLSGNLLGS